MSRRSNQLRSRRGRRTALAASVTMLAMITVPAASASASSVTQLVFWDWSPGQNRMVALFNSTHPSIHVTLEDVGGERGVREAGRRHQVGHWHPRRR